MQYFILKKKTGLKIYILKPKLIMKNKFHELLRSTVIKYTFKNIYNEKNAICNIQEKKSGYNHRNSTLKKYILRSPIPWWFYRKEK